MATDTRGSRSVELFVRSVSPGNVRIAARIEGLDEFETQGGIERSTGRVVKR